MYPDLLKLVFHSEILVLVFKCTKLLKFLFLVFMVQNMYDSLITIYFCSFLLFLLHDRVLLWVCNSWQLLCHVTI